MEIEHARQKLGPGRIRAERFASSQFEVYRNLWPSLSALKTARDNLWKKASPTNVQIFARQLRDTTKIVQDGAIFFADQDYLELQSLPNAFGQYEIGKRKLIDIRSNADFELSGEEFDFQIENNRQHKKDYEAILERVRLSFQNQLSQLEEVKIVSSQP